jgi:endonuclease/exonuclease/phosphatase family metal-dependent hydrolase
MRRVLSSRSPARLSALQPRGLTSEQEAGATAPGTVRFMLPHLSQPARSKARQSAAMRRAVRFMSDPESPMRVLEHGAKQAF